MQAPSDIDTPKKKGWLRRHGVSLLLGAGLLVGICLLLYPTVADWWNQYGQTRVIAMYSHEVEKMDAAAKEQQMADARAYNRRLVDSGGVWKLSDSQKADYESQLNFASNGVMGYININKIKVQQPIYHGTNEGILQTSIGHLEGTSLPVGCESFDPATGQVTDPTEGVHCALTGHRGLPSAKLFSDLDKMVEGDVFSITVLDETFTYRVDQIRIVLPEDLADLQVIPGQDLCTLVTCTPYGINTHRLLVRGHRVDNALGADSITPDAIQIPRYIAVPAVGVPMLFLFLAAMLVYYRKKRPALEDGELEELLNAGVDELSDSNRDRKA